jgi:hypothetical protein
VYGLLLNVEKYSRWAICLETLFQWGKLLITSGWRSNFPCDSRPRLCVACKTLRELIKHGEMPDRLYINTMHGRYLWLRRRPKAIKIVLRCPHCKEDATVNLSVAWLKKVIKKAES